MLGKTRSLFELLFDDENLKEAALIGGTALSIQIGYRLSGGLDFSFLQILCPLKILTIYCQNFQNRD
ncbi:hypothetical protein [Abyssogena phaseoliformis symbiont]|uniref:hypothetical protein n=1 Tax=Abyssogena phaseoliformis symbiont TaxID=596095 RepID=UPI001CEC8BDD|nr:hypothetical protein [Abyssogena phaseoliformis symbiont]